MLTPTLQWSSAVPTGVGDGSNWATDWNLTTNADQIAPVSTGITKNAPAITGTGGPNLFANPNTAFAAFQFALPGESGTRNELRFAGSLRHQSQPGEGIHHPRESQTAVPLGVV